MENIGMWLATIIIPFIVQLLKKMKLPSKFAPIVALVLAIVYVAIARVAGIDADLNTIVAQITQALTIAGIGVLGYDTVKKITE